MEDTKVQNVAENTTTKNDTESEDDNPFGVEHLRIPFRRRLHCGLWVEDVKALGWFGRDKKGKYTTNPEVLEYLHIPKSPHVKFDLTLKHKDDEMRAAGIDLWGFYQWIMDHHTDANGKAKKIDANFVLRRFDLQKLMCTPYEKMKGWKWVLVKEKGVIYGVLITLRVRKSVVDESKSQNTRNENSEEISNNNSSENDTDEKCIDNGTKMEKASEENSHCPCEANTSENTAASSDVEREAISGENVENSDVDVYADDVMGRWGSKFEHYLLSPSPDVPPNPDRPLRAFDDFAVAFSATLGKHKLLYAGEMDGMPNAEAPNDLDNAEFVELKTVNRNMSDFTLRRFKLLQCWSQNVWMKVKYMLMGYRDDNVGVVTSLEKFHISHLPRLADDLWDPYMCFAYLHRMLNIASGILRQEEEGTQLLFRWRPNMFGLNNLDLGVTIVPFYKGGEPPADFPIAFNIPEFYYEWLDKNFDNEGNLLEQSK